MTNKKVVIFGVFDGVHEGHLSFINEAKKAGNHLVAIVARDSVVLELKGKLPKHNEVERVSDLLKIKDIDMVLLGDAQAGVYNVLRETKPDIIFLGYDQQALYKDLNRAVMAGGFPDAEIIRGNPHQPEIFHSSILHKK